MDQLLEIIYRFVSSHRWGFAMNTSCSKFFLLTIYFGDNLNLYMFHKFRNVSLLNVLLDQAKDSDTRQVFPWKLNEKEYNET